MENRIKVMVATWKEEGRAWSNIDRNDAEFFVEVGVHPAKVGITSQAGTDVMYYDVNRYDSADKALRGPATKLVEVTRPSGSKEYYERVQGGGFAAIGGGWVIHSFGPGAKVKNIDKIPQRLEAGVCCLDDSPVWKCLCNPHDRWNGWARPYLYAEDVQRFMKYNEGLEGSEIQPDRSLKIVETEGNEDGPVINIIPVTIENGREVYYLGDLGWIFDFTSYSEEEMETVFFVTDHTGRDSHYETSLFLFLHDCEDGKYYEEALETDEDLQDWARDAKVGDKLDLRSITITRTK